MNKVDQYHSALHDSDNRYHIYLDCPQGNIRDHCRCELLRPDTLSEWCDERQN